MIKSLAVGLVAVAVLMAGGVARAADEEALAKSSGCLNCHAVDAKKMGPSFKETAAKYKGKADAQARWWPSCPPPRGTPRSRPRATTSPSW